MNTVIFVSDSKNDVYADRALLGTDAYKVFLEYLNVLGVSINDALLYNDKDFRKIDAIARADETVRIVTLGKVAEEVIKRLAIPYFALPVINEDNSSLQSLDFNVLIKSCKDYIHDYTGH